METWRRGKFTVFVLVLQVSANLNLGGGSREKMGVI